MLRISLTLVAACAFIATAANASSITVGGQPGSGATNCGAGESSTFLGSSSVTQFNFDGINGSANGTPCTANSDPTSYFHDYGSVTTNGGTYSTSLGNISFTSSGRANDIVVGSSGGVAGDPWADNTPYLLVPGQSSQDSLNLALPGSDNYFGLYWGSLDSYNHITLNLSDNTSVSLNGTQIAADLAALADGNQFATNSNIFVDFFANGATIDSVTFSSDSPAFEIDNLAFGNVPAPGALALLGFGLIGFGGLRRKIKAS